MYSNQNHSKKLCQIMQLIGGLSFVIHVVIFFIKLTEIFFINNILHIDNLPYIVICLILGEISTFAFAIVNFLKMKLNESNFFSLVLLNLSTLMLLLVLLYLMYL